MSIQFIVYLLFNKRRCHFERLEGRKLHGKGEKSYTTYRASYISGFYGVEDFSSLPTHIPQLVCSK